MTWWEPTGTRTLKSECVLHAGPPSARDGYGRVYRSGKTIDAHRDAYERANGPIPEGMVVRHKCNVRLCINPEHLVLGTVAQNADDRTKAGRTRNQHGLQRPSRNRRW